MGRRAQLSELRAAVEAADGGESGLVLVAGEAGVGKTRLVDELAGWARGTGHRVLVGGCVALSAEVAPFAPIVEALRNLWREIGPAAMGALVEGDTPGLGSLLRANSSRIATVGSVGVSPDTSRGRLLETLLGLLSRLSAGEPTVVIIEDVQWADRSTIDALAFLARNLRTERVVIIATYRTDDTTSHRQLLPIIAELGRHPRSRRIDLQPLNRAEVAELLSAILSRPAEMALIDNVYARSQGNPFYSEELLASQPVGDVLPQTLHDVLTARVALLGDAAAELVRVASAAGRRFSESLLESLVDLEAPAFRTALREAVDHQILVRDASLGIEWLNFRHALVQEMLYADLLPSERVRLHATCARAIEKELTVRTDATMASELAYHWHAANEPERALEASIAAGLAAEAAGAPNEAATQFERAIALLDRVRTSQTRVALDRVALLEHAAANLLANPGRAVEHIRAAIAVVDVASDPVRVGLLHAALGRYLYFSGDSAGALDACRDAVALVSERGTSAQRARVAAGLGQITMILAMFDEADRISREAVQLAVEAGDRIVESHALCTLGVILAYQGELDDGLARLHHALEIAKALNSPDDIGRAINNIVDVLAICAHFQEAAEFAIQAVSSPQPLLSGVWIGLTLTDAALALYWAGRWDVALEVLGNARLQPAGEVGEIDWEIRTAQLLIGRGQFEEADRQLGQLERQLADSADTQWLSAATVTRAERLLWKGAAEEASRVLHDGLARVQSSTGANVSRIGPILAMALRAAAEETTHLGRRAPTAVEESRRVRAGEDLAVMRAIRDEIAERWPKHLRLAEPWLALSEAEMSRLEGVSDADAWQRAAALFEELQIPYMRAYGLLREAEALLSARQNAARSRTALRDAYAIASRLSARPLMGVIEEVALRAHMDLEEAASPAAVRPAGLTPREQEILGLLAKGLTNRQIGEHLFITEKTASHHVSSILAKLGVGGRTQAAVEAVRLGIAEPQN